MIAQLMTKIFEMLFVEPPFDKCARINAGRSVTLKIDEVAGQFSTVRAAVRPVEKMIESDFSQRGERRISRQVAANIRVVFIGAHHHRGGVPADQAFDAALDLPVARIGDLIFRRDGIDVGSIPAQRGLHAKVGRVFHEPLEQVAGPVGPGLIDDFVERLHPLGGFLWIEIVGSLDFGFQHGG